MIPRILLVDDDEPVRAAIQMWLERAGFDLVVAESGESALALCRSTVFDLMVIDMVMPGMGGLKAIELIRRVAPAMPIIAVSGFMFADSPSAYSDFPKLAQAAGATLCLRKPFRPSELVAQIRRCLGPAQQPVDAAAAS